MYCDSLKKKNLLDFCENLLENLLKSPKKSKSKSAMTPELNGINNNLLTRKNAGGVSADILIWPTSPNLALTWRFGVTLTPSPVIFVHSP